MKDPETDSFLSSVISQFSEEIRSTLPAAREAILATGEDFVRDTRRDLVRWTGLLGTGELSQEEFEWLVQARVHLAQMESLKQAGLTLTRIDELRMALTRAILGAALTSIGI
jgi:hypothetical protein